MPPENANEPNPTMAKNQDYLDKLAEAAEDLNEVLGCDPAIETEGVTKSDLEGKIKEASGLIDPDEDVFKPATISVLESLGVSPFEAAEELAEEEEEPEDEEEQEEEEEGIDDPTLEEVIASTKKRAALKQIVREEPAFEPLRKKMSKYTTVSSLKAAMKAQLEKANGKKEPEAAPKTKAPKKEAAKKEAPKKEAPAPKAKADKKPAANGYSRIDSVCDAIKTDKAKDFKDLVAISNNIYIEKKGPSADNVAEARTMARYVVKTLRHFGVSVPEE